MRVVDILYFADSLGNMDGDDVRRICKAIKYKWDGPMGIHTHNNQGRGLSNSFAALECGVEYVDSTVLGMGRGAGNTATEILTLELEKRGKNYRSLHLWNLVLDDFLPLQLKYGWGASLLYHFAAANNIHPTYVQSLLGDGRYTTEQVINTLKHLATLKATSFNTLLLKSGLRGLADTDGIRDGKWSGSGWCKGKELLIICAGKSTFKYKESIEAFVRKRKPVTLSLNIHNEIDGGLIDGFVAIDPMRLILDADEYRRIGKPLFTSVECLAEETVLKLDNVDVKDYAYNLSPGNINISNNSCTIPSVLSLAYTFCLAAIGEAERVWLVGFDGYQAGDRRQEEIIELLDIMKNSKFAIDCVCLTPSTYPIKQGSVYAPYE